MEITTPEKINPSIHHEGDFPYTYHRVSTYDPNMCSAARFSPPYTNHQNDIVDSAYENVVLVPCSGTSHIKNVHGTAAVSTTDVQNCYATERQTSEYDRAEIEPASALFTEQRTPEAPVKCTKLDARPMPVAGGQHNEERYDHQLHGDIIEHTEHSEQSTAHIILHRSPNGHVYQNFYVNQDLQETAMVELVHISGEQVQPYEAEYLPAKSPHNLPPVEYNYHPKLNNNGDLMDHLTDTTFVHLESTMIPVQEPEFLDESYSHVTDNQPPNLNLHVKDQQRILLESTMSPLLAAVNDITQRDAELQSYLNQSLSKHDEVNVDFTNSEPLRKSDINNATAFCGRQKRKEVYSPETDMNVRREDDCLLVCDKPVETRARASLPTSYLYFGRSTDIGDVPCVFAKKELPLRTKFGPFEGEAQFTSEEMLDVLRIQTMRTYPVLLLEKARILDVTNENNSNWMRFVRLASTFSEQNLILLEESGKLYFKCCRLIKPKEELKLGYSTQYADQYGLRILVPTEKESQDIFNRENPWACYECDQRFPTSSDMQNHLSVHEIEEDAEIEHKEKLKARKKKKPFKRLVEVRKNSSRCCYCMKVFMTSTSLKKHMAQHLVEKRTSKHSTKNIYTDNNYSFKCNICYKKFKSDKKLKSHKILHIKNELKLYTCPHCNLNHPTSAALAVHIKTHSNRNFKCVFCPETFKHVNPFKLHVTIHAVNGTYTCHLCKKKYREYNLVRKHIKVFHPAVKFSCNECGRQFINMNFLRRHKVCHSEKREFLCSECGKQFKRKDKLREHILRIHTGNKKKTKRITSCEERETNDISKYLDFSPVKESRVPQPKDPPNDFENFTYKCHECMVGFKRRGMLVNHLAKRHPNVHMDTIPELNLPIIKPQSLFYCQYCSKVYKSNGKRKVHILKNHPGQEPPPSVRNHPEPSLINVKKIGNVKTEPQRCQWCYKQYATRNRLLSHYRKEHPGKQVVDSGKQYYIPEEPMDIYRPPNSPENKLLKLSSAALELSSLEDRKFFDFLNERSDEHSSITSNCPLDDNANSFPKVDVNFKVVDGEFSESSSNNELNRLPQLFEESIACI